MIYNTDLMYNLAWGNLSYKVVLKKMAEDRGNL